jgi:hypothetical protein
VLIQAAAKSDPQGFILFEDLPSQAPQVEGCANQSTSEPTTEPEGTVASGLSLFPQPQKSTNPRRCAMRQKTEKTRVNLKLVMLFNRRN